MALIKPSAYEYKEVFIGEIIQETTDTRTLLFDKEMDVVPGQFIMFWIPGKNEKPFSLSRRNSITVKRVGKFTSEMFELEEGDPAYYRGPYGNGFPVNKFTYATEVGIIGGGTGIAPLTFLAEEIGYKVNRLNSFIGAKSKDELLFKRRLGACSTNLRCSVEKVSSPESEEQYQLEDKYHIGVVTDFLDEPEMLRDISEDSYWCLCGPERMLATSAEKLTTNSINPIKPEKIFLSLERWMKCGYGICGSCKINHLSVCRDGPVFSYDVLRELPDLNRYKRGKFGERIPI